MGVELTEAERRLLLAIIDAVNVPGRVIEQVVEIKRKLADGLPAPTPGGGERPT